MEGEGAGEGGMEGAGDDEGGMTGHNQASRPGHDQGGLATDDRTSRAGHDQRGRAGHDQGGTTGSYPRERMPATVREVKALGHPLRLRILRLAGQRELTNKQLADRLGKDPGTVLYHVRQLVDAGLLEPAPVRTGESGALEKPYRSTGRSWWIDNPLEAEDAETRLAPLEAFEAELREAGPDSVQKFERFILHLSPDELDEFDRRILAVLDEYIETDHLRRDRPGLGGMFVMHKLAD